MRTCEFIEPARPEQFHQQVPPPLTSPSRSWWRRVAVVLHASAVTTLLLTLAGVPWPIVGLAAAAEQDSAAAIQPVERWSDPRREGRAGEESQPAGGIRPPLAVIDGQQVTMDDLYDALVEASGGVVLEEILLDRLLAGRAREIGVRISSDDIDRERTILIEGLVPGDRQQGARMLREVRRRRGLGDDRFGRMLERNALARAIVNEEAADRIGVTDSMVEEEHRRRFGPRYQVRLITTARAADAERALEQVKTPGRAFGDVAVEMSTDLSAPRGGLLEPISPIDERYPRALREVLPALAEGDLSSLISLDEQYAIVRMERIFPDERAEHPLSETLRATIAADLRLVRERIEMERLLRELLRASDVMVFDPALNRAWDDHVRGDN